MRENRYDENKFNVFQEAKEVVIYMFWSSLIAHIGDGIEDENNSNMWFWLSEKEKRKRIDAGYSGKLWWMLHIYEKELAAKALKQRALSEQILFLVLTF